MARKQREIPKAKVLSLQEVMQKFPDEQAAIDYLTGIRLIAFNLWYGA